MKTEDAEFESREGKIPRSFQGIAAFVIGLLAFAWQTCWVVMVFSNPDAFAMMWPPGWVLYLFFPVPLIVPGIILGAIGVKSTLRKDKVISTWGIILNCVAILPCVFGLLLWFSV